MASDSRVTWLNPETHEPIRWFDSPNFLKTLVIDDVVYGFAGTNAMFKLFLNFYTTKETSEFLLDTVVQQAKASNLHIFIIRYDAAGLKLFAYSKNEKTSAEVLRISSDPIIERNHYAIGSGKYSKEYKKNRQNMHAHLPIRKIIQANMLGLRKAGMITLCKTSSGNLTPDEAKRAALACHKKGGDLYTGGDVKMATSMTKKQVQEQVAIMDAMDKQAKAAGAVCASPVYTDFEAKQLQAMGQDAVSRNLIEQSAERSALLVEMQAILNESI